MIDSSDKVELPRRELPVCHSDESRPPAPPGARKVAERKELVLEAADGTRLRGYLAHPPEPGGAGVVVMPDVRGLHPFYRDLAVRLAEIGARALAIDYFGRTAGIGDRSDGFEFRSHVSQLTAETVSLDVRAAADYLRSPDGGSVSRVFTLGFCMGGGYSWRQSADIPGLAGSIGFYGRPSLAAEVAAEMTAPLLMLAAGADANIPVAEVEAVADSVRSAGVPAQVVVYDGAPHSFFDRKAADHTAACDDAWRQVQSFIS